MVRAPARAVLSAARPFRRMTKPSHAARTANLRFAPRRVRFIATRSRAHDRTHTVHFDEAARSTCRGFRENAMNERNTPTWIFGIAAGALVTMGLIAALDGYVKQIHASATRVPAVVRMEPVTITAPRPAAQAAAAGETITNAPRARSL
jgi:hypothetical protein